jgi:outer membrane lipoprotein-sorting protein
MRSQRALPFALILAAQFVAPTARAANLKEFLAQVDTAGRFAAPVQADFRVQVKEDTGQRHYTGVIVQQDADVYVELGEPRMRILIRGGNEMVHFAFGDGVESVRAGTVYDPIGSTTLVADDFRRFRAGALRMPQITSETTRTVLVSGAPAETSPFVLLAYLLDREKLVTTRRQYYERTVNNLVRMRRDTDFVRVGSVWCPKRSEIEDYRTNAVTTIERQWATDPKVPPDLFDPATFATRSLRSLPQ